MKKIIFGIFSTFLFFSYIPLQSVNACSVNVEPWYFIEIKVEIAKLPPGMKVSIEEKNIYSEIQAVKLLNPTSNPVELVRVHKNAKQPYKEGDYFRRYKLVDSKVYHYDYVYDQDKWDWVEKDWLANVGLEIDYSEINNLTAWESNGRDKGWNVYEDDKPWNIQLPEAETYNVTMLQGDKVYEVPFTLNYGWNEDYDPKGMEKAGKICDEINGSLNPEPESKPEPKVLISEIKNTPMIIGSVIVALGILIITAGGAVYYLIKKNSTIH